MKLKLKHNFAAILGAGILALCMQTQAQSVNWGTSFASGIIRGANGLETQLNWELGYFDAGKTFESVTDYASLTSGWHMLDSLTPSEFADQSSIGVNKTYAGPGPLNTNMYIFAYSADQTQVFLVTQGQFPSTNVTNFDMADGGDEDSGSSNPFSIIFGNVFRGTGPVLSGSENASANLTFTPSMNATDGTWEVQAGQFGSPSPVPEVSTSLLALLSGVILTLRRKRK